MRDLAEVQRPSSLVDAKACQNFVFFSTIYGTIGKSVKDEDLAENEC